jgi:RNA polymerase sigma-70 factor (ECF subfamily)
MSHAADVPGPPLERFASYLRLLARLHLPPRLRGKLGASDLAQQSLLAAYRSREEYRGRTDAELAAWLRQILAHQLAHAIRDLGRAKRDISRERSLEAALEASSARLEQWLAAEQSSPSARIQRQEQAVQVAAALETLPEAQREALVLHYWQGWTLPQIGAKLGRSPAAVAGLLQRGLKALRQQLSLAE